jgi:hypothetical protein
VTGLFGQLHQERELCPPIAFAEGMNGIELGKKMRRAHRKGSCIETPQVFLS